MLCNYLCLYSDAEYRRCKMLSPNNSGAVGSVLNYEESYKELNIERRLSHIRTMLVNNLPLCR